MAAFANEDAALAVLQDAAKKAGILEESVFIMTADHGGHDKTHGSHDKTHGSHDKTHGSNSPEDMTIPWIVSGKGVKAGFVITVPVTTYDTSATALWLFGLPIPGDWDGKPVTTAFTENNSGTLDEHRHP